jgi:hypothetical protein
MAKRFPTDFKRNVAQWGLYNLFMRKAAATDTDDMVPRTTSEPSYAPFPPLLPVKREWRAAVLEAANQSEQLEQRAM